MDTVSRTIYSPDETGLVVINGRMLYVLPLSKREYKPDELHEIVEENGLYYPRRQTEDGNWVEGVDPLQIDFSQFPEFTVDSDEKID